MQIEELKSELSRLRELPAETEIVEFKEAKTNFDFSKLGKYFSALSNEANLKGKTRAWLIFGIENKHHAIVGSQLPDYDLSNGKVRVTIVGKVLDVDYAKSLANNPDLTLDEIIMLDKVQKGKKLSQFEAQHLKNKKLIEGRSPNYFISISIAQKAGQKASYSKNKAFDNVYYLDLIEKAIKEHGFMERPDIDELLWKKLPEWMSDKQKKIKINNLIAGLRRDGRVKNKGNDAKPKWVLINRG